MSKLALWTNDRNFNEEEIQNQLFMHVVEHNDLITKARHDLNARELKIMDFVISKIKPSDTEFSIISTSMYELTKVLGVKRSGRTYSQIATSLNEMRKKDVFIYDEVEKRMTITGWFSDLDIWEDGKVELRINKRFAPFLLQLKDNYTQYYLSDVVQLSSKYSILLYKLMREADKNRGEKVTILAGAPEEFRKWLGAEDVDLEWKYFRRDILKKSIDEINLKIADMQLELLTAKRGRRIAYVEIHNNFIEK